MTADNTPAVAGPGHRFALRVYYEDTDLAGVVYHASYLRFVERGRSEALNAAGVDQMALAGAGVTFAVRRITAEFLAPARLFDQLVVTTRITGATGARVRLSQAVLRGTQRLFAADGESVCIGANGRPRRFPRAALEALAAPGPPLRAP